MEKNVIWAVVLSALFLLSWYHFFPPTPVPPPGQAPVSQEAVQPRSGQSTGIGGITAGQGEFDYSEKAAPAIVTERTLETENIQIVIHSQGAAVRHWYIKDQDEMVDLVNLPEEMEVPAGASHLPLSTFPEVNFKEVKTRRISGGGLESLWSARLPSGIEIEKTYLLGVESSRFVDLKLNLRNPTRYSLEVKPFQIGWEGGLGTVASEKKENERVTRILAYPSPKKEIVKFKEGSHPFQYRWAGIDNRYYLFAMLPEAGSFITVATEKSKKNPGEVKLATELFVLSPGQNKSFRMKMYAGPKGYTQLKKWNLSLEHAVDFGFFGFLGKGALKAMEFLYGITGNYGWAIVLLTCGLQVFLFPLSVKSYKSTAAMKKLQPKIQELQKRYKDDPKRMNQEMMSLYRVAKTNPFGGCLPMILQIPVFWAFFTMLRNSYELRGAPWILWISDLSQKDPFYVLPIVMGGGMFLQQKISGPIGDPNQAKIMMFLPLIFTFMFLRFPSGLVLYWLTNSLLSISTQYWTSKKYANR